MVKTSVSVIVPVYNRRACCRDALRLLRSQTLKNIEFIIIDDGSTDGTYEYLVDNTRSDKRFKIYKLNKNSGPSVARNFGLKKSKGQYIGFFDIDDAVPRDYFSKLYKIAETEQVDIVFATYNNLPHKSVGLFTDQSDKIAILRNGSACDKLFRADVIKDNDILFPNGLYCADNVFVFKAFYYAKTIFVCDTPSYEYKLSSDSISKDAVKADKRKSDILTIAQKITDFSLTNSFDSGALAQTYHFLQRTFNNYVNDASFSEKFANITSAMRPENLAMANKQTNKGGESMLWAKIKRFLGLIEPDKYDEINLFHIIRKSGLFDEDWYTRRYKDVIAKGCNPIKHYLETGWHTGCSPSPVFDNDAYLTDNPDVAAANMCPLMHYINHGKAEGRYVRALPMEQSMVQPTDDTKNKNLSVKQRLHQGWTYPIRVYDEYNRLINEIKNLAKIEKGDK
jgi:glycosyltransferase involved in cell wall biosynthesis